MNTNRRKFLRSTTALTASAAAGSMLRWGVESAEAQATGGYKAIVCVFLFGGNDSNNMIVPVTDYPQYAATRTAASNVAIPQAQLLTFSAARFLRSKWFAGNARRSCEVCQRSCWGTLSATNSCGRGFRGLPPPGRPGVEWGRKNWSGSAGSNSMPETA